MRLLPDEAESHSVHAVDGHQRFRRRHTRNLVVAALLGSRHVGLRFAVGRRNVGHVRSALWDHHLVPISRIARRAFGVPGMDVKFEKVP